MYTIQLNNNNAIGIDGHLIGNGISPNFVYSKKKKNWLTDELVVDIDNNKNIVFLEYYPLGLSALKYNGYALLSKSLRSDIKELCKYSYCYVNDSTYYFPMINILIWTNKGEHTQGYSVGIYKYGYYDECVSATEKEIINNKLQYKIGEIIRQIK